MDLQREVKKEGGKIKKYTKLRKKCYIWYIERKFNEKCGHLDRHFKERASFVMEQLLLKRIM